MPSRSDSESDIEMNSAPLKTGKLKKMPDSPTADILKGPKKMTTKEMINEALQELKTRKGVSYQAIKKYLVEKYQVDTDKMNFYIKKYLKTGVESGTIVQVKGNGASGSFRLVPVKKTSEKKVKKPEKEKKEKKPEKKVKISEKSDKEAKKTEKLEKKPEKSKKEKTSKIKTQKKVEEKSVESKKKSKPSKEPSEKTKETKVGKKSSKKETKVATQTPAKKKTMLKRKSIGSIIKPPKMKPKAK